MRGVVRRSWLLVPCDDATQIEQAAASAADVVVLDLMEFVPEGAKAAARERLPETISQLAQGDAEVFVQVDKELLYADLSAAVQPGIRGILIPRLESPQEVAEADALLWQLEDRRGFRPGTLQIIAVLDTAKGSYAAMEIARASRRLWGMTLGRADLVMDLRPEPSGEIHLMPYLMQRLITVANAAGLAPLGAWWRAPARGLLANPDDTYGAAVRGRRIGFKGALCLRPNQVDALNRGFTPENREGQAARELVADFDAAMKNGAAVMRVRDRIIDLPTATQARQLLTYAEACTRRDAEKTRARQRAPL
ncbi:MAG TPA: aldolase/citrate lyase family protein [Candidatus Tectomicrobia bacterium]|jgi:citrate lyase subunit beta/citryl-CoA lyase|nr:aldolase/citrate lyase family protein [Candidatus Tectomicrobia bacterium]